MGQQRHRASPPEPAPVPCRPAQRSGRGGLRAARRRHRFGAPGALRAAGRSTSRLRGGLPVEGRRGPGARQRALPRRAANRPANPCRALQRLAHPGAPAAVLAAPRSPAAAGAGESRGERHGRRHRRRQAYYRARSAARGRTSPADAAAGGVRQSQRRAQAARALHANPARRARHRSRRRDRAARGGDPRRPEHGARAKRAAGGPAAGHSGTQTLSRRQSRPVRRCPTSPRSSSFPLPI